MFRILLLLIIFPISTFAFTSSPTRHDIEHVVYVTLDGVRWQDFYDRNHYFSKLWQFYGAHAEIYGEQTKQRNMEVASIPVSLPSYQSQMSGEVQPCQGNHCGRIKVETFPEKILLLRHLHPKEIAVFSSWLPIDEAVQHIPETVFSNVGNVDVYDPIDHQADEVMRELNLKQANDPHPNHNRRDQYTFAQALHYLKKHQPLFLWISLVNADDAAHAQDLNLYHRMLKFYDDALISLLNTLKDQGLFEKTMIIITTDHGRGNGDDWVKHGPEFPESKLTWAFVIHGKLTPILNTKNEFRYNTLSIRPTIEKVLLN